MKKIVLLNITLFLTLVLLLAINTSVGAAPFQQTEQPEQAEQRQLIYLPVVATGTQQSQNSTVNDSTGVETPVQAAGIASTKAVTIGFSGYTWTVKSGDHLPPGAPNGVGNNWSASNVSVGPTGDLHLKITNVNGKWYCAEISTTIPFGFGKFQWQVISRLDQLDPNIVLGLFTYPTPNVGPDGTNEIDIEFARWGSPSHPPGNYTVYPAVTGRPPTAHTFNFTLQGTYTTQRFTWQTKSMLFQSLHGHTDTNANEFSRWTFAPRQPSKDIPQKPVPVHINLWLFQGHAPTNQQPVEVVIHQFKFTP
mgnify:CR=1 FL=1